VVSSTVDVRAATEAGPVQHGLVRLDAVVAAGVDGDRAVVPGAGRDHVGGDYPVTAPPGEGQQAPQLGLLGLAEPGLAQLRPQLDDLTLQSRDLLLRGRRVGDVAEEAGHRPGHRTHQALGGAEDRPADPAQTGHGAGGAGRPAPRVERDQGQGRGQQHAKNQAGPPTVVHRASSSTPLPRLAA